jgi:hypothetical protein
VLTIEHLEVLKADGCDGLMERIVDLHLMGSEMFVKEQQVTVSEELDIFL